jgi:arginine exporter protein ArgO
MIPMIDMQLLNDALVIIAAVVGVAIIVAAAVVATAGFRQRWAGSAHVRAIEKHLAEVAAQQAPARTK